MIASTVPHLSVYSHGPSVQSVLATARQTQEKWSSLELKERLEKVRAFRRLLAEEAGSLARLVDLPERSLTSETLSAEVLPLAEACRFLERSAKTILKPRSSAGIRRLIPGGVTMRTERAPWGVVLVISAGNYPIFLPGVQAIQSLVAGNAVVLKPAPGTAEVVTALSDLLVRAGFDPDLLVVLDQSPESAQRVIAAGVDKVLFTGSSATGREVLAQLAEGLTPATLELSGCDAVFVHPEADLEMVAEALGFGLRFNSSATCIAPRRVLVGRDQAAELEEKLAAIAAGATAVTLTAGRARSLQLLVLGAIRQGARLVGSGLKFGSEVQPVVLADVTPEMEVAKADIFAPVISIMPVTSFEEALEFDRHCPYSLSAAVFGPHRAAARWAAKIRAGVVLINDLIAPTADPQVPFGGRGESGFGTTRGAEGLLELTQPKTVLKRRGRWRPHFQVLQGGEEVLFESLILARHGEDWRRRARGWLELGGAVRKLANQKRMD